MPMLDKSNSSLCSEIQSLTTLLLGWVQEIVSSYEADEAEKELLRVAAKPAQAILRYQDRLYIEARSERRYTKKCMTLLLGVIQVFLAQELNKLLIGQEGDRIPIRTMV